MLLIYIILSFTVVLFLLKRKQIDFLSIGALTFILYTSPCFIGTTWIKSVGNSYAYYEKIHYQTYICVLTQLLIILLFLLYKVNKKGNRKSVCYKKDAKYAAILYNNTLFWRVVMLLCAIGFIYNIFFVVGVSNFFSYVSKSDIASGFSLTFTVWGAILCILYFVKNKKYVESGLSFLMVFSYFILGSRAYLATSLLGLFFLLTYDKIRSFSSNIKLLGLGLLGALFLMLYKNIYVAVRALDFLTAKTILTGSDISWNLLESPEFITVFSNYDYIVRYNFNYPMEDILARFLSIIPFANNFIETKYNIRLAVTAQYDFYDIHYGAGSNFWGESYAMGGMFFVFFLTFLWLYLLDKAYIRLQRSKGSAVFITLVATYCSFYIHRLDWIQVLGCIKAVFLYYACYKLYCMLFKRKKVKYVSFKNVRS